MEPVPQGIELLYRLREPEYGETWPDYVGLLSLGPEHVPELIRIVGDPGHYTDPSSDQHYCATIHARRALGQLRAVSAVGPLLDAMDRYIDYDDYWTEELHDILAMMGPAAIPELARKLQDETAGEFSRATSGLALEKIAREHPESREECVGILTRQLSLHDPRLQYLNGGLVSNLVGLEAVESIEAIERAYEADVVDPSVQGDLEWVRYDLGLGPKPDESRYDFGPLPALLTALDTVHRKGRPDPQKLKAKRKAQKQSRKRNRKHR
jgi:hypothetical protein